MPAPHQPNPAAPPSRMARLRPGTAPRTAFTLLEATVVLAIAGILLALVVPRFRDIRDASAVRGAMAELGGQFALARQSAVARRTATAVVLDTASGTVEVRSGGVRLTRRRLKDDYGIVLASNLDSAVYDARGFGFGVTNLTLTVRRGRFVDTLTMSRLGRTKW